MEEAINRTTSNEFPLDVVHLAIDHMDNRKDFTIDQTNYKGLEDRVEKWKELGIHTVIILDPGIMVNASKYNVFTKGKEKNVFIKWPNQEIMPEGDFEATNSTIMVGYVSATYYKFLMIFVIQRMKCCEYYARIK